MTRLPGLPQVTSGSLTVNLTASQIRTYSGTPASTMTLTLGSVVHGVDYYLLIPAGSFTTSNGLLFSGNWNIFPPSSGYTYDQTKETVLHFWTLILGGVTRVFCNTYQVAAVDTTAPTVVSASATGSALTVVYSEAVITTATTGLSLSYTTGTARTITGITSGSGTTTIVYSLSGAVSGSDVATFVVAGGAAVADAAGNAVTAGSTSITFSGGGASMPTTNLVAWYNATKQTADGIAIGTQVKDYGPGAHHGAASAGVSLTGNKFVFASARIVVTGVNNTTTSYTAISKVTLNTGSSGFRGLWATDGGEQYFSGLNGSDQIMSRHNSADTSGGTPSLGTTTHVIVEMYDSGAGTITWYIDNMATAFGSASAGAPGSSLLQFGCYGALAAGFWAGSADGMAYYSGLLDATQRANAASAVGAA